MIDTLVYAFQVLVVFVTTVAATAGALWFLSLPWRKLLTEWEPQSWSPTEFAYIVSSAIYMSALLIFLFLVVFWSFAAVL